MSSGYQITRPIEYNISRYVPGLTESAVNIFRQQVDPVDFSADRATFQFKSPGLNALLSSQIFL